MLLCGVGLFVNEAPCTNLVVGALVNIVYIFLVQQEECPRFGSQASNAAALPFA